MIRQISLTGLVLGVAACLGAGCIDNNRSLSIVGNASPTAGCEVSAQPEEYLAQGLLDLNHPYHNDEPRYVMNIQVVNNMISNSDPDNLEIESRTVQLEQANISYVWLLGRDLIGGSYPALMALEEQERPPIYMSLLVAPCGGGEGETCGDIGTSVVLRGVDVIPREIGTILTQLGADAGSTMLGVRIRMKGTTLGGTEIETGRFTFPVALCWGCLGAVCCPGETDEHYPSCYPGQDGYAQDMLPCQCEEEPPGP